MASPHVLTRSQAAYRSSWLNNAQRQLDRFYPKKGQPHVDTARVKRDQARINAYPRLGKVDRTPVVEHYDNLRAQISSRELDSVRSMILNGRFFSVHTLGGRGTRLKMDEKYMLTPKDLAKQTKSPAHYVRLLKMSLGERHMLALAFQVYLMAKKRGENPFDALKRQTSLIIPNKNIESDVLSSFKTFENFGFGKVKFASSPFLPGAVVENGIIREDPSYKDLHNHGSALLMLCMDETIFTVGEDGIKHFVSPDEYRAFLSRMDDQLIYSIEDINYFRQPIDLHQVAIAMKVNNELGCQMLMEVVRQRALPQDPQKGGMLVIDPKLIDPLNDQLGRLTMIESFQLNLPPAKLEDGSTNPAYDAELRTYQLLNRNFNQYMKPVKAYDAIRASGLPVHILAKTDRDGVIRLYNNTVMGDVNCLDGVSTYFVAKSSHIRGLKTQADIPSLLRAFMEMDGNRDFREFLAQFIRAGVVFPDYSFAELNQTGSDTIPEADLPPLQIGAFTEHPWFIKRATPRYRETLNSLGEVFTASGTIVFKAHFDWSGVRIRMVENSRRGTAKGHEPRGYNKEEEAGFVKTKTFMERRVWTGKTKDERFSFILICNRHENSDEGEIVLLLGEYDEEIASDWKIQNLKDKLDQVAEYLQRSSRLSRETIEEEFGKLKLEDLYASSATHIGNMIRESLLDRQPT
ncbi:MAG: hypothetical protein ABIH22_04740 [Candidatus Margulisiibacteriota bacterium]